MIEITASILVILLFAWLSTPDKIDLDKISEYKRLRGCDNGKKTRVNTDEQCDNSPNNDSDV